MNPIQKYQGCLLGGAVGDALGAPIEFMSFDKIVAKFGSAGLTDFVPAFGRVGAITDDTQMTLFTAEGLLRSLVRFSEKGVSSVSGCTHYAYKRWLYTQEHNSPPLKKSIKENSWLDGWLIGISELYRQRAPGTTCLSALRANDGNSLPKNNSKGCGTVMRMAPVGMIQSISEPFEIGVALSALTHGHPTGQIAAGMFASLIRRVLEAETADVSVAVSDCMNEIKGYPDHEETLRSVALAVELSRDTAKSASKAIPVIGEGWIAEEALAIAIYCSLKAKSFEDGVLMAVNHSGDSDSTGSITGNILGAVYGVDAVPKEWLKQLELYDVIATVADDIFSSSQWLANGVQDCIWERYPGH